MAVPIPRESAPVVQLLHDRPELRDLFPIADVVDVTARWSA